MGALCWSRKRLLRMLPTKQKKSYERIADCSWAPCGNWTLRCMNRPDYPGIREGLGGHFSSRVIHEIICPHSRRACRPKRCAHEPEANGPRSDDGCFA